MTGDKEHPTPEARHSVRKLVAENEQLRGERDAARELLVIETRRRFAAEDQIKELEGKIRAALQGSTEQK